MELKLRYQLGVAVFGSSDPLEGSEAYADAIAVGRVLAEQGYAVINGAYGGTMEASARGAKDAGGVTRGVGCSLWRSSPNAWIDEVSIAADYPGRLFGLIERASAGFVALPGATGTLVELALVWEMRAKRLFTKAAKAAKTSQGEGDVQGGLDRPVVCFGEFWRPILATMGQARVGADAFVHLITDPEALRAIFPRRT